MSAIDNLTDGRIALAKSNIRLALSDLGSLGARASELDFCDEEWQECVGKAFSEQERLLREALEALARKST